MVISADIKCYHCGHVSGQLVGEVHEPVTVTAFRPAAMWSEKSLRPGDSLRCFRCGGPVFLDDVQTVKPKPIRLEHEDEVESTRGRRGRAGLLARRAS